MFGWYGWRGAGQTRRFFTVAHGVSLHKLVTTSLKGGVLVAGIA